MEVPSLVCPWLLSRVRLPFVQRGINEDHAEEAVHPPGFCDWTWRCHGLELYLQEEGMHSRIACSHVRWEHSSESCFPLHMASFAWTGNAAGAKDAMCSAFAKRLRLGVLLVTITSSRPATLQGTELKKTNCNPNCDWMWWNLTFACLQPAIPDLYTLYCEVYVWRFEH